MIQFCVLGPFEVLLDGRSLDLGPRKQRAVLAALTIEPNRVVSLDRLIDELWGEEPPAQAIGTLQAYVSNLRRVLEPGRTPREPPKILVTQSPGYVLRVPEGTLDSARFEALAARGRALLAEDPSAARPLLDEALALWRGSALADFAFESFAQSEAARLDELRLVAQEDRIQADLDLGAHDAAVPQLEAAVSANPLRERLTGMLMLALYRAGRQADALGAYQSARNTLVEELGIDPSPSLRRLEADILAQAPSLDWRSPGGETVAAPEPRVAHAPEPPEPSRLNESFGESAAPGAEMPMVGRRKELERLVAGLDRAAAGRGGAVLVQGEPGIGKTRLVQELLARAAERAIPWAWGGSIEGGGTPAYWPWVEVIRSLFTRSDIAPPAQGAGMSELAQVVPEIQSLTGPTEVPAALDPETARLRLFEAMTGILAGASTMKPLVVVLDDLQWADAASFQLLSYLAPKLRESHLLLVGTYRPAEIGPGHPLRDCLATLSRHQVVDRVELEGLGELEVADLIEAATGAVVPGRTVAAVRTRTEGNPFFVTELARLLASEHDLAAAGGLGRAVPAGVRDVVRRRLRRLPEETMAVLSLAAVAGRDFELRVLEAAAELNSERTLELVEAALMSGLVLENPDLVGRFRFSHDLVRETILEELTASRRARLHARVGEAIDVSYGEDAAHALELANHFFQAAPAVGAERAIPLALVAADVAYSRLAYEQAEEQLQRALELLRNVRAGTERDRKELQVQLRINSVAMMTQGYAAPAAGRALERARELCLALGESRELVPVLWGLFAFHFVSARYELGHEIAQQLLEIATRSGDPAELVAAHHAMGSSSLHRGHFGPAREHLEKALSMKQALEDPWLTAWLPQNPFVACACFLAFALWELGEAEAGKQLAVDALKAARKAGHDPSIAHALDIVAWVAALDRDVEMTLSWADEAVAFSDDKRFPLYVALNSILRGWSRAMKGEAGGAEEIAEGIRGMKATGAWMLQTFFLTLLAEAKLLAGAPPGEALELYDEALGLVTKNSEGFCESEVLRQRGELLLEHYPERREEAERNLRSALETAVLRGGVIMEERARESLDRAGKPHKAGSIG